MKYKLMNKDNFINSWLRKKNILEQNYIYKESDEHSSCGVGLIASLDGNSNRKVVEMGVPSERVSLASSNSTTAQAEEVHIYLKN